MACSSPLIAVRDKDGDVSLKKRKVDAGDGKIIQLPCGSCVGCQMARARSWAIRCELESRYHSVVSWCTLTFSDAFVPPTLSKADVSHFFKRLRKVLHPERVRFFASGEYGEAEGRPHYHAILFGTEDALAVEDAWPYGISQVDKISPAAIAYVAGYAAKKVGVKEKPEFSFVEGRRVVTYQPPFVLMSRKPGIGGDAREYWRSWRNSAIWGGREVPVPRFLHDSYLANASDAELSALAREKESAVFRGVRERSDGDAVARSILKLQSARRSL